MSIQSSTLRPGLLVSLNTTVRGNVTYRTQDIERERITANGAQKAKWETERTIADPKEHEAATKVRSKIRSLITSVCSQSAFGLLCPEAETAELEKAIVAARVCADEFNATARLSRVGVYVITGRIAADDVEAVRAINSEVRGLLESMSQGVANLDVETIRASAMKAKSLGQMLSPDAEARIQIAINTAREAAVKIRKAGEQAAQEIDRSSIRKIAECRTAFLDLGDAVEISTPVTDGRAIDLDPDVAKASADYVASAARQIEL